eukprot:m.267222 g.267222  ORF g.267222 m.267222 type:complete len:63 (-) comp15634_c5_seq15:2522-2710(-)
MCLPGCVWFPTLIVLLSALFLVQPTTSNCSKHKHQRHEPTLEGLHSVKQTNTLFIPIGVTVE